MKYFKSWNDYHDFERQVLRSSRYILTKDGVRFLDTLVENLSNRARIMKKDHGLCRAQLGHDWRDQDILDPDNEDVVMDTYPVPAPFRRDRMKPLPDRAKEGRLNPKGIPYLYLSDDKITAMSEVRPWLGSKISVAYFKTVKDMKLIDLSLNYYSKLTELDFMYFGKTLPGIRKKTTEYVWKTVDRAFSMPVTLQDDTADYAPTQIIGERFRSEGYDGVYYRSALREKGYNIALFDINSAEIGGSELHELKTINFEFEEVPY